MTKGKTIISISIWYVEWNINFLKDSLIAVMDWDNWRMYRLDLIYDKYYTVNKTPEVKEILSSIWFNL